MHYFSVFFRRLLAAPPDSHRGSISEPAEGLSSPDPSICPTLEKILRAPIYRQPLDRRSGALPAGVDVPGILEDAWLAPKMRRCRVGWGIRKDVPSPAD